MALSAQGARRRARRRAWRALGTAAALAVLLAWGGAAGLGLDAPQALRLAGALDAAAAWRIGWRALAALVALEALLQLSVSVRALRRSPAEAELDVFALARAGRAARADVAVLGALGAVIWAAAASGLWVDLGARGGRDVSPATLERVRALRADVAVQLFYPAGSAVLEPVQRYAEQLAQHSAHIHVEVLDRALAPAAARAHNVRANGLVVLCAGARCARLPTGLSLAAARPVLRTLDAAVRARLDAITAPLRPIYCTTGHGELALWAGRRRGLHPGTGAADDGTRQAQPGPADPDGQADGDAATGGGIEARLAQAGLELRPLDSVHVAAGDIPADAAAVALLGPSTGLAAPTRAGLARYLAGGGAVLALLDPLRTAAVADDDALTELLGVTVARAPVGQPRSPVRTPGEAPSAHNLVTTHFGAHPSVTTLSASGRPLALVLPGAAAVRPRRRALPGATVLVRAMPNSWEDLDGNGLFDADSEPLWAPPLAVALEGPTQRVDGAPNARVVVVGDVDWARPELLRSPGNAALLQGALEWLVEPRATPDLSDRFSDANIRLGGPTSKEAPLPLESLRWLRMIAATITMTLMICAALKASSHQ